MRHTIPFACENGGFPFLILKFLLPVTAFGFLALARFPASDRGDGPTGAPWHRRLGYGTFPRPAQHGTTSQEPSSSTRSTSYLSARLLKSPAGS